MLFYLSNPRVPKDFPMVLVNEDQLKQILHNLIGNAAKFTTSGSITTSASISLDSKFALVSVEDTGIGISRELLEQVFEPFVQAQNPGHKNEFGLNPIF
jgi:two-component system sensor histidine kinase ChiS